MIAHPLLVDRSAGDRVVWGGRGTDQPTGALHGWNCGRTRLLAALEHASELVILDALSFPWESLGAGDRDVPLVVVLPDSCDAATINAVLGRVLLDHLTPHDRLVENRADVRAALAADWCVGDGMWLGDSNTDTTVSALLRARSEGRLTQVETSLGVFHAQQDDLITEHLREYGSHQKGALNVLLSLVGPSDVVIDVGAHIGTFAVPLARRLGEQGRLLAIEGHPVTAALLARNVCDNRLDEQVTTKHAVLGRARGPEMVTVRTPGNSGGSSFVTGDWGRHEGTPSESLDSVLADLAEVFQRPAAVKIDVEGAELAVLEGAQALIERARPLLLIEVGRSQLQQHGDSVEEMNGWFQASGYRTFLISGRRQHRDDDWELVPLPRLADCSDDLFDVLAVPEESTLLPDLVLKGSI